MKNNKIIGLSFDDKSVKFTRHNTRTIVDLVSYFRSDRLEKYMEELGFSHLPGVVENALKKSGYTYDYKLHGYKTKTTGIVILDPRDADEQSKANRIAMTKAKAKAYDRANRCFDNIKNVFANAMILFDDAHIEMSEYAVEEKEALERAMETGYCNPDKQ